MQTITKTLIILGIFCSGGMSWAQVIANSVLDVQPEEGLNFGLQQTGSTSAPLLITISNDGNNEIDLEVTGFTFGGAHAADFDLAVGGDCQATTFSLSDGESCTQGIAFSPGADGAREGVVTVESDAGETLNDTVPLEGEGIPTDAILTIDPDFFDFLDLDIDAPAECEEFTLANSPGVDSLTIGTASVAAPFSVSDSCNGFLLGGGESCVVEVCFDPETEGAFSESLMVTTDLNDVAATVEGEGTSTADVSVNPPFGPVDLGIGEPGEQITANAMATNDGSANAQLSCDFTGGDTNVISIDPATPFTATVPTNGAVDFTLNCALPEEGGGGEEFTATLACDVDGEPAGEYDIKCGIAAFEPPLPIPTMQPWALALLALLMLLTGGMSIRHFRTD